MAGTGTIARRTRERMTWRLRRAGILAAALTGLILPWQMSASASAATGPNLAFGRAAVASSLENSSYPAGNAVDGKTSTRWSSSFNDPQWVYVDLGSTYNINEVVLNWETAY